MRYRGDLRARHEIQDKTREDREFSREKGEQLDTYATDAEIVERTLEALRAENAGTTDGAEEVEGHIERAGDVTVDAFARADQELETLQAEIADLQNELQERAESVAAIRRELSEAHDQVDTQDTGAELAQAEAAAERDR
jgi:predicted RNase H-like nuclease (RuvC/YqgF family)